MLLTAGLTALVIVLSASLHYEALRLCNHGFRRIAGRARVLLAIAVAFCSHLAHIALFAGVYWMLQDTSMGSLRGQVGSALTSFLYFSAETYTSLGFGDLVPTGAMRLIAGLEALTGLLMISWSASFTYLEMNRQWGGERVTRETKPACAVTGPVLGSGEIEPPIHSVSSRGAR